MIMITIIVLYFIQIRHADDFPSTGPLLVTIIINFIVITPQLLNLSYPDTSIHLSTTQLS